MRKNRALIMGFALGCLITSVLNFPEAHASQTLDLEDSYRDGSQTVCVYSNGRSSAVVYKDGAGACPSKHIKRN
ncbi:hypothetical protein A73_182 [Escherichia phage A73]|uniref:Uncharacterized protein n=1 Tax=Escherichia phage A73 TaxID=3003819 RepID=A0AAF0AQM0_9CAUD|nr:hypothetical protein A73_182 [Escherichia phage A73]WBF78024.1 hypothetical protein W70_167 [Escherichia phage W70]